MTTKTSEPATGVRYTETILRFRVYRIERMPERHGGDLRKYLVYSFDDLDAAWEAAKTEQEWRGETQFWTVEDHGETVQVERVASFF